MYYITLYNLLLLSSVFNEYTKLNILICSITYNYALQNGLALFVVELSRLSNMPYTYKGGVYLEQREFAATVS